jgi:hypothetical protein
MLPSWLSKIVRGRHDNHRRSEIYTANGSRFTAGGWQCGSKASESFALANEFTVGTIVGEKFSIAFFCPKSAITDHGR